MENVFLFPGQGSQKPGMGKALVENFAIAKQTYDEANDHLGINLSALCFEGSAAELALTENAQPAILTTSMACYRVLRSETGITPAVCVGHSLGEYTALVVAGALAFKDALTLVRLRGQAMQKAVPEGKGGMAAIIGLVEDDVQKLCVQESKGQVVAPANFNGGGQVVVSGDMEAVDRVVANAKDFGAKRAIKLKVSAPFHSDLMKPAAQTMEDALGACSVGEFKCPVIGNVDAKPYPSKSKIRELLVRQVTDAVRWEQSILYIVKHYKEKNAIECGHGTVLKGLCKRIDGALSVVGFGNPSELEHFFS